MEWLVELEGDESILLWLMKNLPDEEGRISVHKEGESYYLVSFELETMNDAWSVRAKGKELALELCGIARLHYPYPSIVEEPVMVAGIQRRDQSGKPPSQFLLGRTAVGDSFGIPPARLVEMASQEPKVSEVLQYLGLEPIWPWLTNILDVIERDIGANIDTMRWATRKEIDSIGGSANHPAVGGFGVRHAITNKPVPPEKSRRSLSDSIKIVERVTKRWLEWIQAGRPRKPSRALNSPSSERYDQDQ